ncbi:MAG: thymidine kinase [Lactobacillales bacterium]|jgi:thymidine kinase|nr:thymidine kinase [Lactobacillales bacterium]
MAKLHFYYSVMESGKSTALIQTYYNYKKLGFNPLIIKPSVDTRDGKFFGWGKIKSRILNGDYDALYLDHVTSRIVLDPEGNVFYNVVLVDEAQFFTEKDIESLSDIVDIYDIPVVCYGLKTDCHANLFAGAQKLLVLANDIREIKQICRCGRKATMHVRRVGGTIDRDGKTMMMESDGVTYESVCRKCYKEAMNKPE